MKAEIIQAQREIIQGYYIRIGSNPNITVEDIMQMLEGDLQYIREETLLLDAENIINAPMRHQLIANAINGIMANPNTSPTEQVHFDNIAEDAIKIADTVLSRISNEY